MLAALGLAAGAAFAQSPPNPGFEIANRPNVPVTEFYLKPAGSSDRGKNEPEGRHGQAAGDAHVARGGGDQLPL